MKYLLSIFSLIFFLLLLLGFRGLKEKIGFVSSKAVKVPEPSDIAFDTASNNLYVVSDNGVLYECDPKGNIQRRAPYEGVDFEGVEVKDDGVYVVDEATRQLHRFNRHTLEKEGSWYVPYNGGRNKGYESLAYNPSANRFLVITERDPVLIRELNEDFIPVKEYTFNDARDISAARWYDGYMYLLSDEDHTVFRCDPVTYKVLHSWKVNIHNPEGLAFDRQGGLIIISDDRHRLYFFDKLK